MPTSVANQLPAFVGRQPIFDRMLATEGYELLFRLAGENHAVDASHDGTALTAQVVLRRHDYLKPEAAALDGMVRELRERVAALQQDAAALGREIERLERQPDVARVADLGPLRAIWASFSVVRYNFWASIGLVILVNVILLGTTIAWQRVLMSNPVGLLVAVIINAYIGTGLVIGLTRRPR